MSACSRERCRAASSARPSRRVAGRARVRRVESVAREGAGRAVADPDDVVRRPAAADVVPLRLVGNAGADAMTLVRYFAYGSNMLTARLQARCPSARPLGRATARGRRLAFHKRSDVDGSGKCDLVPADDGALVVGVVFDLAADELPALDRAEGAFIYCAATVCT